MTNQRPIFKVYSDADDICLGYFLTCLDLKLNSSRGLGLFLGRW